MTRCPEPPDPLPRLERIPGASGRAIQLPDGPRSSDSWGSPTLLLAVARGSFTLRQAIARDMCGLKPYLAPQLAPVT